MERFEEILTKYNFTKRANKPKTTFEEAEKIINFKLPNDYKTFALNYSGLEGFIGEQYVRLWDFDEVIEMNIDYQIFEYLPNTLAIGGNGGGEYIAIERLTDNSLRFVLSPFLIEEEAHIEIGISFTDFLERLENRKVWFE
ncbi:SMI1/KNR4 family protein [Pedobacter sp. ISL-68]|uniref:SMI1/KNR4 family protein n=1 Tax=unclassified Pedobacter TaxID=2628915 RepID=UPI001BED2830|nr:MULTISPECIES: SMI1/KNR4 family protein [unclassified Pedobacter]MBT2563053.1 SMI1/KNR4 family protein [Pedobacter sp. ISL-64]MBT2593057.1 SMI1/KNR4 family protein [Pedobacter sp. ISL-68]